MEEPYYNTKICGVIIVDGGYGEKESHFRKLSCLEKIKNELALQETHS